MARTRALITIGTALVLSTALAACTSGAPEPGATPSATQTPSQTATAMLAPAGTPSDVTTGLDVPWSVVFAGTTPIVSERDTGRILELHAAGTAREVGRVDGITPRGEGGLLGLAVQGEATLYAYSTGSGGNRIERFTLEGTPGSMSLGPAETVVADLPASSYHNGGRLAFGPDGMLYASIGDTGDRSSAQDVTTLSGKILRMTADGTVPEDNPFPDSLVYSYGHRNVQGLGWASDGTMFASEFGQDAWDELNIITPGGNYGWPDVEGLGEGNDFINPVQVWAPRDASPSGLTVIDDTLFIANLRGETLRAVPVAEPSTHTDHFTGTYGRLRAVTAAPDGNLWIVTNNTGGQGTPADEDDRIISVPLARAG
ncbi:PQQ-dependent sugar dehydrogenase [Clavibacter zhangzhiyongii]|uniref:PQQ-dependent sugar dehydrogenase n=1 Tax=Clavibacter zhangzhiyongii TaxID=2768071 RepID=UPI0039E10BED